MSTDHDEPFDEFVRSRHSGSARTGTLLIAGDKHLAQDLVPSASTNSDVARTRSRPAYYPEPCPCRTRANAAAAEQVQ
ncbi:hypothetical protein [Actinoplanes utahensis]|uniref:Uncharacterized protein n=1 Tax=Actinoplanes utahensis TaxID=1869 RepID=A0A0A6URV6_ACTUT|nr:hypothetical protein [Actinoplanes utahensis]KHD77194.1 hypothetical protein MB27_12145 [Actinoplanes utahensis]GIF33599.1 hypothetical protein Aut01nite_65850 [Actinoplanes utahensis]